MTKIPLELFPLIFESVNDGVFTVDEHFRITSFNAAAEKITGVQRKDAIGQQCHDVFKADICQKRCALRKTLETGEPKRDIRVNILNIDMEHVPITVSTAVLKNNDGKMIGGVEIFQDISDVEILRSELKKQQSFKDIIGQSAAMHEIFSLIPQVAKADVPVLVRGPSGTGKELIAQAIHDLSLRKNKIFVRVNCGALPDTLLESELFGYKKGAFTGAVSNKPGRFEQADGGTLFLDEIGDISPAFQVKLLRALEEGEIQPLGGTGTLKVNVRIICATNRDLEKMVSDGSFREDLYYRIRVIPVDIPPLEKRREDIPLLADHFIKLISTRMNRNTPDISHKTMRLLYDYDYPGNVRELRNILERASVLCTSDTILPDCLPPEVLKLVNTDAANMPQASEKLMHKKIEDIKVPTNKNSDNSEARKLRTLLDDHNWNRTAAARAAGVNRTTLWRWMKKYGIV